MADFMALDEYRKAVLNKKEISEREYFFSAFNDELSKIESVRPGDDHQQEPDIVTLKDGELFGYEVTELWLSKKQAESVNRGKDYSIEGLSTFDLLNPLSERLSDKFKPLRGDGKPKYRIEPTTLLVVDRTGIPFYLSSHEFMRNNLKAMKNQDLFRIDFTSNFGIFDIKTNGTPVNSVSVVQQILKETVLGSRVNSVLWFIPEMNTRIAIAYS